MLQFDIHRPLGLLGILDCLRLKGLNRFDLPPNVIIYRLESLEVALYLVDNSLVL